MLSHDIEDIVAVIDGRTEIVEELKESQRDLMKYLSIRFSALLQCRPFLDSLAGHMPPDQMGQARLSLVEGRMQSLAALVE